MKGVSYYVAGKSFHVRTGDVIRIGSTEPVEYTVGDIVNNTGVIEIYDNSLVPVLLINVYQPIFAEVV